MKTTSLIRRVIFAVLLIQFCCTLAFVCTAIWHEWSARLRALEATIQGRSDSLIGAVQDAEDPGDHVKVDPLEFKPPSSDVYAVYNPNGQLVGTSENAPPALIALGKYGFHNATVDDHHYRVLQRNAMRIIDREETGGAGLRRPVIVVYAGRTNHVWHEVLEAVRFYVLMSLLLLCVTAGALIYPLRLLWEPLRKLASEAALIDATSLTFEPPPSALRIRELVPLADALSKTIARLRLAFEMEHRFMNDAAHELKTAVAVVRSSIQLLIMRNRGHEEYQHGLDQVLEDNVRVEGLLAQMLTLARISERHDKVLCEVDLALEVESALKNIASFAGQRGIQVVSSLAQDTNVRLSPNTAQILVSNLVMNSVQHSSPGSEVRVAVRLESSGNRSAVLEVRDFGSGIAAQNLPHVFERFFREDPSRSRETGGVGLGLAICKSIVESAGGRIELESVQGEGTNVKVSFHSA